MASRGPRESKSINFLSPFRYQLEAGGKNKHAGGMFFSLTGQLPSFAGFLTDGAELSSFLTKLYLLLYFKPTSSVRAETSTSSINRLPEIGDLFIGHNIVHGDSRFYDYVASGWYADEINEP